MSKPQKHTIGSFLRAVYPGMPDLAAASKSEVEVIMDATCELNRIRALVIRDRDGRVVTQGAFNALECRYYQQLTDLSSKDVEIVRMREVVTQLCRETLGAIIDATTILQVEKLSGNVVKEAQVKGELHTLRLFESWLDRHVPEAISELRRRVKEGK